jgi:polyisoprenoid-binding protein YceI
MSETTAPVRVLNGVELPAAGTWKVDPGHAEVAFIGRHFMLTKVRGRFTGVEGTVTVGDDPADSRVSVTIDMATVNSGDDARDTHLKSGDLFDVETYPKATFESTSVSWDGVEGTVSGELTIKDVSKPVTLTIEYLGYAEDPWNNRKAVFSAKSRINREDWGVTWNMPLARGGLLVSKEIDLEFEIELTPESLA